MSRQVLNYNCSFSESKRASYYGIDTPDGVQNKTLTLKVRIKRK